MYLKTRVCQTKPKLSWTLAIGSQDKPLLEISSIWVQKVCAANPIGNIMIQCTSTPHSPLNPKHLISSREKIKVPWIPNRNARKLSKHLISEDTGTLSVYSLLSSPRHTRGFGYRSSRFKCNNLSQVLFTNPVQERERERESQKCGGETTNAPLLINQKILGRRRQGTHINAVLEHEFEVQIFSCNDSLWFAHHWNVLNITIFYWKRMKK